MYALMASEAELEADKRENRFCRKLFDSARIGERACPWRKVTSAWWTGSIERYYECR